MKATTIKLGGDLLREVELAKPADMSVTSYVKEAVRGKLMSARLRDAAGQYQTLSEADAQERQYMEEWDAADLAKAPKPGKKRTRT